MTGHGGSDLTPPHLLEAIAVEVARMGAELVRSRFGQARATHTKSSPTDVVTETDLETEHLIRTELAARSPRSTIIGEELADQAGDNQVGWIVDPIDGTINFLYDLPVVSVSIAATHRGVVVAGAVTDVAADETYSAADGVGARRDGSPIAVSDGEKLEAALVGTGFAYGAEQRAIEAAIVGRVLPRARDVRCFGSAALHLCWVACGRLDAYYQRGLAHYDYAAGALIAAEAGATVELPNENEDHLLLAATPRLSAPIRALVQG